MYCYIKEWPNKMATLMTVDGVVLCTFKNIDEAQKVWRAWRQQQRNSKNNTDDSAQRQTEEILEAELQILAHSPSIIEWIKNIMISRYADINKAV